MSVIVKGMKMPELYETYKVNFAMTNDGKIVMGMCLLNETGYRPVGEVVALPDKHGRLGDLDALFDEMEEAGWYNNGDRDEVAESLVMDAPTIVEAEGNS